MSLHTPPPLSVFRELNYTPLERKRERERGVRKKRQRRIEKWSLLCLVWRAMWKYSSLALQRANIRTIKSDGAEAWHLCRSYCTVCCHGNN